MESELLGRLIAARFASESPKRSSTADKCSSVVGDDPIRFKRDE